MSAYFHLNYFIHFIKTRIFQLTSTHSSIIMDRRAVANFSRLMCCILPVFSSDSWLGSQKRSPELQLPRVFCDLSSHRTVLLTFLVPCVACIVQVAPNSLDGGDCAGGCGWSCVYSEVTTSLRTWLRSVSYTSSRLWPGSFTQHCLCIYHWPTQLTPFCCCSLFGLL